MLVTGHPYVDVWEAVKPATVGIRAWPQVPRGTDWKTGRLRGAAVGRARRRRPPRAGGRAQLPRPGNAADRGGRAAHRLRDRLITRTLRILAGSCHVARSALADRGCRC